MSENANDSATKNNGVEESKDAQAVHKGACCCGAIKIEARGDPMFTGYCHCYHCRAFTAAELSFFIMYPNASVTISGEDNLSYFDMVKLTGVPAFEGMDSCSRARCKLCGQAVMALIGGSMNCTSMESFVMRDKVTNELPKAFEPKVHTFYKNRVMDVPDGLPKYEQLPSANPNEGLMKDEP